jgi:hypothetical protein
MSQEAARESSETNGKAACIAAEGGGTVDDETALVEVR